MPTTESSRAQAPVADVVTRQGALNDRHQPEASEWQLMETLAGRASGAQLGLRGFVIFQTVFWMVATATLAGMQSSLAAEVDGRVLVGRILTGVLLSSALYFCYRHRFTHRLPKFIKLGWILALNVIVISVGPFLWQIFIGQAYPTGASQAYPDFANLRIFSMLTWNIAYFSIVLVLQHKSTRVELYQARAVARAAELKQLQMQLNPHFLFNALNAVMGSLEGKHQAREIIQNLADFLRFSLEEARPLEPFSRELNALEAYLGLQQMRFQDGLECCIEASPAATRVMVPPMLIQPLLENAFKYAPLTSPLPLRVNVRARVVDGWLEAEVSNSGRWQEPVPGAEGGIGLDNLRRRISLLMGAQAKLSITTDAESVCVRIRFPVVAADRLDSIPT